MGIIAIVAILIFGPKKIPELGSTIGKTLRNFKEGIQEVDKDPIDDTEKKSD
jgi:sec-independent protein translocase protein TatA